MRTTGRARRGTRATTACRRRERVVPRDAGHRGQRILSRLSGREPGTSSGVAREGLYQCRYPDAQRYQDLEAERERVWVLAGADGAVEDVADQSHAERVARLLGR